MRIKQLYTHYKKYEWNIVSHLRRRDQLTPLISGKEGPSVFNWKLPFCSIIKPQTQIFNIAGRSVQIVILISYLLEDI